MIEIHSLTKRYGTRLAVDDLTVSILPGRVTGLLGPNGAGKSTTIRVAVGLDAPTSGWVRVAGSAYRDLRHPLRTVGTLLDAAGIEGSRTPVQHLRWIARSQRIDRGRVDEVLGLVGLAGEARRPIATFSLGMRQRLGIATTLLGDPAVLVLDEPMNGLDPEGVHWIRGLLRSMATEGRTVLVSSHLITEMAVSADRLVVIGGGRLLADTTVAELAGTDAEGAAPDALALEAAYLRLTSGHSHHASRSALAHPAR